MFKGLKKLITGSDGSISHSKLWSNIANMVVTVVVLYQGYLGTLTDELTLIYLAVVSGHATASKILTNKLKVKEDKLHRPRDDNY